MPSADQVPVAGAIVANLAKHHRRPFHEIEHIELPFMVRLWTWTASTSSGGSASLISACGLFRGCLADGLVGLWPVPLSCTGGGSVWLSFLRPAWRWAWRSWRPITFAGLGETLLAITIGTAIVFELFGPILVALRKVGEAK